MNRAFAILVLCSLGSCFSARADWIADDLLLLSTAKPGGAQFPKIIYRWELLGSPLGKPSESAQVSIQCKADQIEILARSSKAEKVSSIYYGIYRLGFLFPKPRTIIQPNVQQAREKCGKTFQWQPRFKNRGFHLHTQHASEWVEAFFMGREEIGRDSLMWMVRNMQNTVQLQMIRYDRVRFEAPLARLLGFARDHGLTVGLGLSFASQQQKSYSLIPLWRTLLNLGVQKKLRTEIQSLADRLPFDYLAVELGTSEFTSTDAKSTLRWIEWTRSFLAERGKKLFCKIHVSSNQKDARVGNFNFLPRLASPEVGVLPHTVMFYALDDAHAPVYGRENFSDIREFLKTEAQRRPTWYFPETSYYIGMDIDVPIFLTDYLLARSHDADLVEAMGVTGHIDFTTGQELGYWLQDWSFALTVLPESRANPTFAVTLLGEDRSVWQEILNFQHQYFNNDQLIETISTSNLMDELYFFQPIHHRTLLRKLLSDPEALAEQIRRLQVATQNLPSLEKVRSPELRAMLEVTHLRVRHALLLREAIKNLDHQEVYLTQAAEIRQKAKQILENSLRANVIFPEAHVFEEFENPTSYSYGYGWSAKTLFFWQREEEIVRHKVFNPFFQNIYNIPRLLF